jgi:hypothetical protein
MANVISVFSQKDYRMQELADDLEGALRVIAYTGLAERVEGGDIEALDELREMQRSITARYSSIIKESPDLDAEMNIQFAYSCFLELGSGIEEEGINDLILGELAEDAKDLIYEYLCFPEEMTFNPENHEWEIAQC